MTGLPLPVSAAKVNVIATSAVYGRTSEGTFVYCHVTTEDRSSYIHGSTPEEQRRLSLLNSLINESSLKEMNLQGGESILDVGSGLGQFTRIIARKAGPSGKVIGIERRADQIEECRRLAAEARELDLIEVRQGDVTSFPLKESEWGTFDIVHSRFLLEHLRSPQVAVENMVRALHPGGRIILEDDDHDLLRFWPEPPGAISLWKAYYRSFEKLGNDPAIGRKLASLLQLAGARPVRINWIFFGACAGQEKFPALVENLVEVVRGARDQVLEGGLIDAHSFDAAISSIRTWQDLPDASIWYGRAWAEGKK